MRLCVLLPRVCAAAAGAVCVYIHTNMFTNSYVYVCMYIDMCMYVYIYLCIYVRGYIYTYIYMYTYTVGAEARGAA